MQCILLFFVLVINITSYAQQQVLSLKEICCHKVVQFLVNNKNIIKDGLHLPDDLIQELEQNYFHQKWQIPSLKNPAKIRALNTFYCFVQSDEVTLHRIDLLGRSTIEKHDIVKKIHTIADKGHYFIFGNANAMKLYEFKSNSTFATPPSDKAWICNNIFFIFLQNDLLSIWKLNATQGHIYHQQSLINIKNCYTFPWQSKILVESQVHNSYRYSLYNCTDNRVLDSWHVDQPLAIYATHPQHPLVASTTRHNKQDLYISHLLSQDNPHCLKHIATIITACFLPELNAVATVTEQPDNTLRIWDMSENKSVVLYAGGIKPTIESLWWSPRGLYLQDKENNCWFWHQKIIKAKKEW